MTTPPTPDPGAMTVPPLFGWEHVLTVLVVVLVLAVLALAVLAAGRARPDRAEWQASLAARSAAARWETSGDPSGDLNGGPSGELSDRSAG